MNKFRRITLFSLVGLWVSHSGFAMTTLKQIEVKSGTDVRLIFDGEIDRNQVTVDYRNDIVQLSLNETAVYPAKITPVPNGPITKVFAYQYSPRLVRCRFSIGTHGEPLSDKLKDQIQIKTEGNTLSFSLEEGPAPQKENPPQAKVSPDAEEKALLNQVLEEKPKAPDEGAGTDQIAFSQKAPVQMAPAQMAHERREALTRGKPALPSIWGAFGKLVLVLGLFLGFAFALKLFKGQGKVNSRGILGALSQFAKDGLRSQGKVIDVVSTHYLDPKKYIAVVRVAERTLVLGVSNDSINLITQVSQETASDSSSNSSSNFSGFALKDEGSLDFSAFLGAESGKAVGPSPSRPVGPFSSPVSPVRSRIKNKLEGFKPL